MIILIKFGVYHSTKELGLVNLNIINEFGGINKLFYKVGIFNPLDAGRRSTDFAQTSLRCQESDDRRHGI